jgi:hypothetical protein
LIADDSRSCRAGDSNRIDHLNAGMRPFKPFGSYAMGSYEAPAAVRRRGRTFCMGEESDRRGRQPSGRGSTAGKKKTKKEYRPASPARRRSGGGSGAGGRLDVQDKQPAETTPDCASCRKKMQKTNDDLFRVRFYEFAVPYLEIFRNTN